MIKSIYLVWATTAIFANVCNMGACAKDRVLKTGMTKAEAEETRIEVISAWRRTRMHNLEQNLENLFVTDGKGNKMKFLVDEYGQEPDGVTVCGFHFTEVVELPHK